MISKMRGESVASLEEDKDLAVKERKYPVHTLRQKWRTVSKNFHGVTVFVHDEDGGGQKSKRNFYSLDRYIS